MEIHTLLLLGHIIGVAFGLGGATVSDIFFMRILRRQRINAAEFANIKVLSRVVWAGITILVLSGVGFLLLTYSQTGSWPLLGVPRFQAKLTLVGIVLVNGSVFHFYVFPKLKAMIDKNKALARHKWLFAVTGAISATSWYAIVVIALFRQIALPYWGWMAAYFMALAGGILTARVVIGRLLKD